MNADHSNTRRIEEPPELAALAGQFSTSEAGPIRPAIAAGGAQLQSFFQQIFERPTRFCVREVDFASARSFWHPDFIIFGTHQEHVRGLAAWTDTQCANAWPRTEDFAFDLDNTSVLASPDGDMAVVMTPWTSTGFHPEGSRFDRPGRAAVVLVRRSDGRWIGVHSHLSLERRVPQQRHGNRPIKAP